MCSKWYFYKQVQRICYEIITSKKNTSIVDLNHFIENGNMFCSPCDEFEFYNVLNWIIHPNWSNRTLSSRFLSQNISNVQSVIYLLIEHGLSSLDNVDIHIQNKNWFEIGDFIEYKDTKDHIVAGKIVEISLTLPLSTDMICLIRDDLQNKIKDKDETWYLILPSGRPHEYAEWLPSSSIVPLTINSKSFIGETMLKRFQRGADGIIKNKIYESILSGQNAHSKRRDMIRSCLTVDCSLLISLIEYVIYSYLFK